ncbi:MAG: hypothetical protein PWP07_733 [Epulopiscium sp.]|jgi:hypothetical protein|uniref:Uncharacterized protein n=1 Tax=Defluviitalea raffinosedens TaxID=1450156 RepID=A0A7C8LDQ0_9FIRM|nr:hypothetical protein [Defluviitalea raffinosedens]KAE9633163.1 hypothetical protein GND95_09820 [Defluviitalea raffinosedens]MBM7686178.1 hypothetical protein [Defluviitalea raffinosedens]MDK2787508.1 hypothetical protein [Candidatus Epulonipiscium sp.]
MYLKKNSIFLGILFLIVVFTGCTNKKEPTETPQDVSKASEEVGQEELNELTKEQALAIEKEFFNRVLHLEMDENTYEIIDFHSKEDLMNYVSEVADRKLAESFVDSLYEEKNGKLYIIPKGGPAMIAEDFPFELNKLDEHTYELVQEAEDMLLGPYKLTIRFKYLDNTWKMSSRKVEQRMVEENTVRENDEIADQKIKEIADQVIYAISKKDGQAISEYVHPEKGVRFTPYTHVSLENDVVFGKEEMKSFFDNPNVYLWGYYDGSGEEIKLTPSEYYEQFIYSEDFMNAPEVGYNEILSSGNMLENQFEVYDDPMVVEYYFPGFNPEYEGLDWKSLRLVFEKYEGSYRLVGIIHNQWTI